MSSAATASIHHQDWSLNGQLLAQADAPEQGGNRATEAAQPEESPKLMKFDPGVGIWSIVVFLILLGILWKAAWKPILKSIEDRDRAIKDSLDKANKVQEESRRIADEQNKILAQARSEAAALLQSTKQAAEDLRRKMEEAAATEKARILASAGKEIEAAKNGAIAELKRTSGELSIQVAEKLIQESLDDSKHRQLVDRFIAELGPKA